MTDKLLEVLEREAARGNRFEAEAKDAKEELVLFEEACEKNLRDVLFDDDVAAVAIYCDGLDRIGQLLTVLDLGPLIKEEGWEQALERVRATWVVQRPAGGESE